MSLKHQSNNEHSNPNILDWRINDSSHSAHMFRDQRDGSRKRLLFGICTSRSCYGPDVGAHCRSPAAGIRAA